MISDAVERLRKHINNVPVKFSEFDAQTVSTKPAPGKWSKKEILGHLVDSACNNHSRFVRPLFEDGPLKLIKYAQDDWVINQKYTDENTADIVTLWKAYNTHILHILSNFPEEKLSVKWDIAGEIFDTEWLITDYVDHMEHHLKQIFN